MKMASRTSQALFLFFLGVSLVFPHSTFSMGGALGKFDPSKLPNNWKVKDPKIVVAYGYFDQPLIARYSKYFRKTFEPMIKKINPSIRLEIIPEVAPKDSGPIGAQGADVVKALRDPNTVGFIFISHTFKAQYSKGAISLSGDGHPLPVAILSAATPALRFAAILGCYGPGALTQYEVKYALERLPGQQVFYYSQDRVLSANFMGVDNLKKILNKIGKDLDHLEMMDFTEGDAPPEKPAGKLMIRVKDVFPRLEPRYVYVNGKIVGMMGADHENSNTHRGYQVLTYDLPQVAIRKKGAACDQIKIVAAEISPGVPADNYLIDTVYIGWEHERVANEKSYSPPLHFGYAANREFHEGHGISFNGSVKDRQEQYLKYITRSWLAIEWMDHNPEVWKQSPLNGRFYIDCI